jgi:hypothetical protein
MVYLRIRRLLVSLPHLNHLIEVSFVWDESSASNVDTTVIPTLARVLTTFAHIEENTEKRKWNSPLFV